MMMVSIVLGSMPAAAHVGEKLAADALAGDVVGLAGAHVYQHELAAGVEDDRIVGADEDVRGHVGLAQRRLDVLDLHVG
jgi:hypothetical protein